MKNTIIVTILILLILIGGYWVFKPVVPSDSELNLIHQRDSLMIQFKSIQASYDLEELKNKRLTAELLKSKAVVKRSEDQLNKAKANEKVYLKRIKEQTLAMSEIQADSVIKSQLGPDSTSQKVVMKLAELDACDSIRQHQDNLITSLHESAQISDSIQNTQSDLLKISRTQFDILQSSSQIDKHLLGIKDTKIKKGEREKKWLKSGLLAAIVYGIIQSLK